MKKHGKPPQRTVAFLYNVRHQYPDPNDPKTQLEADFDDPSTIKSIIEHLENCDCSVIPIEADESAYAKLKKNRERIDLAFNYSLGMYGLDRYAQLPAILEMLQIPYTGPRPMTEAIILNKARMKEVIYAHYIPTLPFQHFNTPDEKLKRSLHYPLIVKPVSQGSSAGITNDSVVWTEVRLREQLEHIMGLFNNSALVEPFITGREFSIPMLGNPPKFLPFIEADHSTLPDEYYPMDSLEVKWILEEEGDSSHLVCPAQPSQKLQRRMENICRRAWDALELRDFCRIDVRCDSEGKPFILDVNSPPGFIPPEVSTTSYFPLAAREAGMNYEALLRKLFDIAEKRLK
jgi:D-alanine-D-alanine ligase